jgi:hypothetical protein
MYIILRSADPGLYASVAVCRESCCFQLSRDINYMAWLLGADALLTHALCVGRRI